MDFGRAKHLDNIDFFLPSDLPLNEKVLEKVSGKSKARIFIGCPVWAEKSWIGKVYPAGTPSRDLLPHYSRQFNSIELNTTHYRIPSPGTVASWKEATPAGFRFCPKIPQVISHDMKLVNAHDLTIHFCEIMSALDDRLGMFFLQLPPWFGPERLLALEEYVKAFPTQMNLAVELRHEGWFSSKAVTDRTFGMFEEFNITPVITDVAARRDVLHMRLCTPRTLIRFTANDLHPTDFTRMDAWAERLKKWIDKGLEELYFFAHTPDHALYPEVANYMIKKLNQLCNVSLRECRFYNDQQQSLF